jgi:hypothetical protein
MTVMARTSHGGDDQMSSHDGDDVIIAPTRRPRKVVVAEPREVGDHPAHLS